jgi:hypothetical protein
VHCGHGHCSWEEFMSLGDGLCIAALNIHILLGNAGEN